MKDFSFLLPTDQPRSQGSLLPARSPWAGWREPWERGCLQTRSFSRPSRPFYKKVLSRSAVPRVI